MNTFVRSSVTVFQTLGERLQRHRDQRHLTVEDVSRETGIPAKYVVALEQGAYQTLPGEAYVRHFLKQYAALLGVGMESVFPLYERERAIVPTPDHTVKPPNVLRRVQTLHLGVFLRRGIIAVIAPLLFIYLGMKLFDFLSPPDLIVITPVDNTYVTSSVVHLEGKTESDVRLRVNGQEIFSDPNGGFGEDVDLRPGLNALRIVAVDTRGKERVVTRNIFYQTKDDEGRNVIE